MYHGWIFKGKKDGWGWSREAWWSLYGMAFTISFAVSAEAFRYYIRHYNKFVQKEMYHGSPNRSSPEP